MGLLDFISGKSKTFDAEAAEARAERLRAVLPADADVSIMEPDKGSELTYLISVVGQRDHAAAVLDAIVEIVSAGEERWTVSLVLHETDDEDSNYSSFELPRSEVPHLAALVRAHDEIHAQLPGLSITLDASDGSFSISDVPRDKALPAALAAVRWWEGLLAATSLRWSDSTLAVSIGDVDGNAEISYGTSIEREPDPMGYHKTATGSHRVDDAEWVARVCAAWNDTLPALQTLLRLPVLPGHEVDVSFAAADLRPRLSVYEHESYDDAPAAAKDLVAQIRAQLPDSTITAR